MAKQARAHLLVSGNTETDADKQAKEAESGKWPNQDLLRAVCLMTGLLNWRSGYWQQAGRIFSGCGRRLELNTGQEEHDALGRN